MGVYPKTNAVTRIPLLNTSDTACLCELTAAGRRRCPTEAAEEEQPVRSSSEFIPAAAPRLKPSNRTRGRGIKNVHSSIITGVKLYCWDLCVPV